LAVLAKAKMWYDPHMKKKRSSGPNGQRRSLTTAVILGRQRFARISAVEGIELSPAAKRRAAEFDRLGLSPHERVRAIVAAHRKD
jgi:hypothetical protein